MKPTEAARGLDGVFNHCHNGLINFKLGKISIMQEYSKVSTITSIFRKHDDKFRCLG